MKIAILHHHLNRGGVTQVVLNHLRALKKLPSELQPSEVLVLHGGRAQGWVDVTDSQQGPPISLRSVRGLDYDEGEQLRVDELADSIAGVLEAAGCGCDESILHVHNHSLGKNASLPGALRRLAARGYRQLLHLHDFAEDLRPANYLRVARALCTSDTRAVGEYLYPSAPHIHYALLNSRDRRIFLSTGVAPEQVHWLPNPVTAPASLPDHATSLSRFRDVHKLASSARVVLYPVRGIRRKNVGELLLWAAVAGKPNVFALTLPATSGSEQPAFERWRELAKQLDLPVLFDVGLNEELSFHEIVAAASRIISTSVAEGFGLTFLESWLHERLLIGRNLPEITADFADRGVNLEDLGSAILVPIDWVGADDFAEQTVALQAELCDAYGRPLPESTEQVVRERIASGYVDFAVLMTAQQVAVISRVHSQPEDAEALLELNPWMRAALTGEEARWSTLVESNATAVRNNFSLESTAQDLSGIYGSLMGVNTEQEVAGLPRPDDILTAFLDIRRLNPVRVEP